MTISSTTVKTTYAGDASTTSFSTVYAFWNSSENEVILVSSSGGQTTYTEGTQYTVTGGGGATGTIVLSSSIPPSATESLIVQSNLGLIQETDFASGGAFPVQALEDELDRTVRRIQQLNEQLDRAPKLSTPSTFTGLTLPDPVANQLLAWDSSADGTIVNASSDIGLVTPIAVGSGGTGSSTLTDGGVLLGSGTGAITAMAVLADGEMIVGDGTTDPVAESGATLRTSIGVGSTDDVTINSLTLNGGQVAFPASQNASADANTLDDYEEGTWTPVLTFATPGDLSVVYSTQVGSYTKTGDTVTIFCTIQTSTFTHTTASGNCNITGLPFTSANVTGQTGTGCPRFGGVTNASYTALNASIGANSALVIFLLSASAQTSTVMAASDMPTGGAVVLQFSAEYKV